MLAWGGRLSVLKIADLKKRAATMRDEADRLLQFDGVEASRCKHAFSLDMRYAGQSFTMPIDWDPAHNGWEAVRKAFDARHNETFGYVAADNDVEIVNVRLVSLGLIDKPNLTFKAEAGAPLRIETRRVYFGKWIDCPIYHRDAMELGFKLDGPAIIEEEGGTTVVPPGWTIEVQGGGAFLGTAPFAKDAESCAEAR